MKSYLIILISVLIFIACNDDVNIKSEKSYRIKESITTYLGYNVNFKSVYYYDEQSRIIRIEYFNEEETVPQSFDYFFYQNNRLDSTYSDFGNTWRSEKIFYNGDTIDINSTYSNGAYDRVKYILVSDQIQNIITFSNYANKPDSLFPYTFEFLYWQENNLIYSHMFSIDMQYLSSVYYEYDDKKNPNSLLRIPIVTRNFPNSLNNITRKTVVTNGNITSITKFTYQYNEQDLPIEQIDSLYQNPIFVLEHKYIYEEY